MNAVNLGLLIIRLDLGAVMLAHGINHIFGGGKIAGTGRWFGSLGMKPGHIHAWLASLVEVGSGVMLVLGLLNPLAASGVIGVMVVAFIINHRGNGFFIFRPGEGWEYVMTLTLVALALTALGPGEWSLDHALDIDSWSGTAGLVTGLIAGFGGALALLVVFWRPAPKEVAPKE